MKQIDSPLSPSTSLSLMKKGEEFQSKPYPQSRDFDLDFLSRWSNEFGDWTGLLEGGTGCGISEGHGFFSLK